VPLCARALWAAGGSLRGRAPGVAQALCPLAASTATLRVPAALLAWSLGGARGPKTSNRKIPVILIQDAPNLGFRGEEVAVRPGYARNFLIPQQLVVYSTHENKSLLLQEKSAAEVIPQPNSTKPIPGLISALLKTQSTQQVRTHLDILFSGKTAQQVVPLDDHANATS
jgi:hypothetical protein